MNVQLDTDDRSDEVKMKRTEGNLPPRPNPCCGYVTSASATIDSLKGELETPSAGDMALCLNCGAVLTWTDPAKNEMRYARRSEIESMPRKERWMLAVAQRYIRERGWISEQERRAQSN